MYIGIKKPKPYSTKFFVAKKLGTLKSLHIFTLIFAMERC